MELVRSLVPRRFIDLPEALRSMIRTGLAAELESDGRG
jgi:hypothetical protein